VLYCYNGIPLKQGVLTVLKLFLQYSCFQNFASFYTQNLRVFAMKSARRGKPPVSNPKAAGQSPKKGGQVFLLGQRRRVIKLKGGQKSLEFFSEGVDNVQHMLLCVIIFFLMCYYFFLVCDFLVVFMLFVLCWVFFDCHLFFLFFFFFVFSLFFVWFFWL